MTVNLNPKSFQDTPLAELCFEEALKVGVRRSADLKQADFRETSIRFCVDGLRDWYAAYVDSYGGGSLYSVLQNIGWHWASFCETDATLTEVRTEFIKLRKEITEKTAYTDLTERMKQSAKIKEFGYGGRSPFNISLPREVIGIVGRTGASLGIPFSKFFQIGLGWSLSTNQQGLYKGWTDVVFGPLFGSVMSLANGRIKDFAEIRAVLLFRDVLEEKKR